jgi:hypothetical protein
MKYELTVKTIIGDVSYRTNFFPNPSDFLYVKGHRFMVTDIQKGKPSNDFSPIKLNVYAKSFNPNFHGFPKKENNMLYEIAIETTAGEFEYMTYHIIAAPSQEAAEAYALNYMTEYYGSDTAFIDDDTVADDDLNYARQSTWSVRPHNPTLMTVNASGEAVGVTHIEKMKSVIVISKGTLNQHDLLNAFVKFLKVNGGNRYADVAARGAVFNSEALEDQADYDAALEQMLLTLESAIEDWAYNAGFKYTFQLDGEYLFKVESL